MVARLCKGVLTSIPASLDAVPLLSSINSVTSQNLSLPALSNVMIALSSSLKEKSLPDFSANLQRTILEVAICVQDRLFVDEFG